MQHLLVKHSNSPASLKVISENEMFGGVCAEMKQHLQSQSHFSVLYVTTSEAGA